jgi:hypothetical protein
MALPTNVLEQVATYQSSNLAYLLNHYCFINKSNKKFKNFEKLEANLGSTVTFDLPPRYTTTDTLIVSFQDSEQRSLSLTVDQSKNVAASFSAEQFIFNVRDYMDKFGMSAMAELGNVVEADVAKQAISGTYRFYGDGVTAINSYQQLATAAALLRNYGAASGIACGYLDDLSIPAVVGSGLAQFVTKRNEEIANSWELGSFAKTDWYQSNLLATHNAGTVGNLATTLVVTAVTTDSDGGISAITCSGAGTDADAIKQYDLLQFSDGVSGKTNVRFRTFIGHIPSGSPVQVQATADSASSTDSVIISITPKLYVSAGAKQNITTAIVAGMELTALPSHRAGLLYSGDALFLGMPMLPEEIPFPTANKTDAETGCSIRMYYGSKFGENERGLVHDTIWGARLVPEYSMRLIFPL